jgi:hypothetical protein
MKILATAVAASLALFTIGGCARDPGGAPSGIAVLANATAPSLKTVFELRAGYDAAFLAPAANYRRLGLCPADVAPTVAKPCAVRSVVKHLQVADKNTRSALDALEAFVRVHPGQLGASGRHSAGRKPRRIPLTP